MLYLDSCVLTYWLEGAAPLRAAHRLRTPDAIQAACAIVHGCEQLWTNDRRLAVLENRLGTRVVP